MKFDSISHLMSIYNTIPMSYYSEWPLRIQREDDMILNPKNFYISSWKEKGALWNSYTKYSCLTTSAERDTEFGLSTNPFSEQGPMISIITEDKKLQFTQLSSHFLLTGWAPPCDETFLGLRYMYILQPGSLPVR